jgi:hypothetical protein
MGEPSPVKKAKKLLGDPKSSSDTKKALGDTKKVLGAKTTPSDVKKIASKPAARVRDPHAEPKRVRELHDAAPRSRGLGRLFVMGAIGLSIPAVAVGYVAMKGFPIGGKPRPELAKIAPKATVAWFEAEKPSATYAAWKTSESYKDFTASETHAKVEEGWKALVASAEKGEIPFFKELGLPCNERTITLLMGQDLALGILEHENDRPSVVLASTVDVTGLATDLALQGDLAKIWEKISKALGANGDQKYKDVAIQTIKGPSDVYVAFVRPNIIASDSRWALEQMIDVKTGAAPSLADQKAFGQEIDNLAGKNASIAYLDAAFARDPKRLATAVHGIGKALGEDGKALEAFDPACLSVLTSDLKPMDGIAFGFELPNGNLYDAKANASRAEIFQDTREPDVRTLVSPTTTVYTEARGIWDLFAGIGNSPAWNSIQNTAAVAWVRNAIQHPEQISQIAPQAGVALDKDVTFETRLGLTFFGAEMREVLGNDTAFSIELTGSEDPTQAVDGLFFVRSRPLVRIATDVLSGYAQQMNGKPLQLDEQIGKDILRGGSALFAVGTHGEHKVFGIAEDKLGLYWTQIGTQLVIGNKKSSIEAAIDHAATPPTTKPAFGDALAKLPQGYAFFTYVNMHQYTEASRKILASQNNPASKWLESQDVSDRMAFAAYVSKDYGSVTFRGFQTWTDKADANFKAMFTNAKPEPAVWKELPPEAILSFVANGDPKALYAYALAAATALAGEKPTQNILESIKTYAGCTPEQLVGSLGSSGGLALVVQDKLVPQGMPAEAAKQMVAVPALVLAIQLKDGDTTFEKAIASTVRKALQDKNEEAKKEREELEKKYGSMGQAPKGDELAEKKIGDATLYRLDSPSVQQLQGIVGEGFGPCFVCTSGWCLVATSERALVRSIEAPKGKNFAGSPELARLLGDAPRGVASFSHFSFEQLVDQIDKNVEILVLNLTPAPKELGEAPQLPEYPAQGGEKELEAYQKASESWRVERQAYQKKLGEYREKNLPGNVATVRKILISLKVLGGMTSWSTIEKDGIDSGSAFRLDLAASEAH